MKKIENKQTGPLRCAGGVGCHSIIFCRTLVKTLKNALILDFSFLFVFVCLHLIYVYIGFKFFIHYYFIYFIVEMCVKLWKCKCLIFK